MHHFIALPALACFITVASSHAADTEALPRSTPESQGISSASILSFVEAAEQQIDALHSFVLVRHGHIVAEGWWAPYRPASPHSLYSLTKSFTSTAVGLAAAEGRLSLDDLVLSYFPDDAPSEPSAYLKSMRVRDLLRMSTGHHTEPAFNTEQPWTKTFLAEPVVDKPGTHFLYNTPASYMLSAIVQKATGLTEHDYLRPRLFEPLGIKDPTWTLSPQGVSIGGYGLSLRTEDIARFGQLYLQKGQWHGQQLLPAGWVQEATSRQTSNGSNPASDWEQGYGYQFWRCRHGAFRGDGAFGQYCLVLPEQDAVLAITSGVKDMQTVLNLVWEKLLPAMTPVSLPPDQAGQEHLEQKLASLELPTPAGAASPESHPDSGKRFVFPVNNQGIESIELGPGSPGDAPTLVIQCNGRQQHLACGFKSWREGRLAYGALTEQPVAAAGAWISNQNYLATIWFYETPFCLTLKMAFDGSQVAYDAEFNVGFGSTRPPRLTGRLE